MRSIGRKQAAPGRPTGRFTQHRRLDKLRDALEANPAGVALGDLAGMLHVTTRSVRRYLGELGRITEIESIETTPGGAHLWRIKPSERGRTLALRRTQAYGLLAVRRVFEILRGSAFYDELDLLSRQLLQLAQRPTRAGAKAEIPSNQRLEERFIYLPRVPRNYVARGEEFDHLFQSCAELRVLTFRYRSAKTGPRRVRAHPYAVVVHGGDILCLAYDVEREALRLFSFARMSDTVASPTERFLLPDDFNLDDHLHGEFGVSVSTRRIKVLIEFEARIADDIRAQKVHPSQKIATAPDGRVRVSLVVPDVLSLRRWIVGFGDAARVIEPPDLVAEVEEWLRSSLTRYRR